MGRVRLLVPKDPLPDNDGQKIIIEKNSAIGVSALGPMCISSSQARLIPHTRQKVEPKESTMGQMTRSDNLTMFKNLTPKV